LRFTHQLDDLLQGRGLADAARLEPKATRAVDRAAEHLRRGGFGDRQTLAGEHGFVHVGFAFDHYSIDRDLPAGPNHNDVAHRQRFHWHVRFHAAAQHARRFRLEPDELADRFRGASFGAGFEQTAQQDQRDDDREAGERAWSMSALLCGRGLIGNTDNRHVVERCIEWLAHLRDGVERVGFRSDQDALILRKLYGDREVSRLRRDLYDSYETWLRIAETPEQERERKRYPSPSECRQIVMEKIDKEIRRLKRDQKERSSIQAARTQLEIVSRNVPDGPGLDRLLRYEASLERSFDRTLSQLERLQRMRLGQPVLPKLEVHHSLS